MERAPEALWGRYARQWRLLGPPLRPSPQDTAVMAQAVREQSERVGRPSSLRALLLGVTPEIASLPWPAETSLLAVDSCEGMIREVWPACGLPERARAVCADWRAMPAPDGAIDFVAGDGALTVFAWHEVDALLAEIRRVLAPGGRFALRAFVAPDEAEDVTAVASDLRGGRVGGFHAFKWRLAMALQRSVEEGVSLAHVWDVWRELCADPRALAAARGWELEVVETIAAYRGADRTYSFPTLAELRAALAPRFDELACTWPTYELGQRCPTLVLQRRE